MYKLIKLCIICCVISLFPSIALANVSNGFSVDKNYAITYPVVDIEDSKTKDIINQDIKAQVNDLINKTKNKTYVNANMTYYKKYEDKNIVSLMFYVNAKKRFATSSELTGYTITYDKHTGQRVPMNKYLNITLEQLQDALNHSKAYAVDGLDNGVNLNKKIPYVSNNYFICDDGSIGLLYQPGDLLPVEEGATKVVISPETINYVNQINH